VARPSSSRWRRRPPALRISKDLAYELIARGELPALRLGRRVVVPTKALVELVEGTVTRTARA
jgi:excisionase family DNA binding protein